MQVQELLDLILIGEEVCLAVNEATSLKVECGELGKRVDRLSQMLKTLICFINSAHTSLYLRPVDCMIAKLKDYYKVALAIVYKCKHRNMLYRLFTSCNGTHFRELFHVLDASISDMEWLVNVYDPQCRAIGSPANKKCPTFLVWSCIATVHMGLELEDRVQAAEFLVILAQEKDEYKNIIFEEGGVPSLQKLLKEKSPEAQITAAKALCLLANEQEKERIIMKEMVSTLVSRLSRKSPMWDQIQAANLVASIAEHNPELKEYDLIRENVIWRLVTLLSSEQSALKLKISCSKALWMLARGSLSNCRTLTETKGMLCLAKLVKTEQDELQYNCVMIIKEITVIAESDNDFRHSAFKSTSPAAKAAVDELLRVIKEFDDTKLRIPAIKAIGSLARSFSAKETRVITPLVALLENTDQEVTMEAAIALLMFVCTDNHLCSEHSNSIIEFNGVPLLMKLLDGDKKLQPHGLALICYLAKHDSRSNVLIEVGALTALQTTGRKVATEHPELEELVSDAISKLQSNQTGKQHQQLDNSPKGSIKQFITEQSKVVVDSLRQLKLLLKGLTIYHLPRVVNLQTSRCKKRLLQARRSLKTKRIQQFLKAKCGKLALRWMMDYTGERLVMKEIVPKLRLVVNKIGKSLEKKEIRRKFGYIIHKFCKNVICTNW
ncbi:hypothetical protein REPUB_Repub01dG0167200 [Reevesia pubescens]